MRLHFQERPWDLFLVLLYTTSVSFPILWFGHGTLWALALLLFSPGYVLVAILFPSRGLRSVLRGLVDQGERLRAEAQALAVDLAPYKEVLARVRDVAEAGRLSEAIALLEDGNQALQARLDRRRARGPKAREGGTSGSEFDTRATGEIDWTERITLSFGLSIALVSLLGLLLNFTPFGIRLESVVVAVLLFTLLVGLGAYWRRVVLPVEDRLSATVELRWPAWGRGQHVDRALTVAFVASLLFAAGTFAYVVLAPRAGEQFTQFYILDEGGTANPDLLPTRLNVSEPGTVIIGVVNNESTVVTYTVRIDLVGLERVSNETREANRTTLDTFQVTLANRKVWEQEYTFAIAAQGQWKVEFLLFRDANVGKPIGFLSLFVQVQSPG